MNIPQVNQLISKGIKVIDPQTTYIDQSVKITGKEIVIHPNTFLKGNTEIKDKCEIGPNSFLSNAKIDENVKKGQVIARSKGLFGFFKSEVKSPLDGTIGNISNYMRHSL